MPQFDDNDTDEIVSQEELTENYSLRKEWIGVEEQDYKSDCK